MKKRKLLLFPILIAGLMSVTSCNYVQGVFKDDDMGYENIYNPPKVIPDPDPSIPVVNGVTGKSINNNDLHNVIAFRNVCYATNDKIFNSYKSNELNINNGEDYPGTTSGNNYDLYVPTSASKTGKHTLILFIHGGAWVSGFKTDVNSYIYDFANRGYITATIKYTLLRKEMDDKSRSIYRNLDEIDACIKSLKAALQTLEFDTTKTELVIGGASSGAHLAMLYSYSRGQNSALPIKFVIDAVGPTDIKEYAWKRFINATDEVLEAGLDKNAIQTQKTAGNVGELPMAGMGVNWNEFQTMRIANGMCGVYYTQEQVNNAGDSSKTHITNYSAVEKITKVGGGQDQLSVTYCINNSTNRFPIICAYAGKDSVVGINQYANLQQTLDMNGMTYQYVYFKNSDHTQLTKAVDETNYNLLINKIVAWCDAASI